MYKNKKLYGQVFIAEPVKDMALHGNLVFTVKDLDLVITEIRVEGNIASEAQKNRFALNDVEF